MRLRCRLEEILFLACFSLISADHHSAHMIDSNKGDLSVTESGIDLNDAPRAYHDGAAKDAANKRDLGSLAEGDLGEVNRRRLNSEATAIDSAAEDAESAGVSVHKRNLADWPSCRDGFEVHKDKIIRTQDSKALGARYLTERDVASREDCMQLCCSSDNCDVFVFEENKVPGGCYLFECGPPEDFKCKFTKYHNYTSGFLNVNRHINDLEQIKYSQHERELTNLREPHSKSASSEQLAVDKTTVSPRTKEVPEQYGSQLLQSPPAVGSKKGCSRNQFECHSSGECIAIYNACDGIPQCADGSDESPELGCPAPPPTTISVPIRHVHPTPQPLVRQPHQQAEYIPEVAGSGEAGNSDRDINIAPVRKQWPTQDEYNLKNQKLASGSYQQKLPSLSGSQLSGLNLQDVQRSGYGREGEELLNYRGPDPSTWTSTQYRHNQGTAGSQIFTHKGEGLLPQNNRFQQPQHSYVPPETQIRSGPQYNDPGQTDYAKYYSMENANYNRMYGSGQGAVPNSWQTMPKPHNLNIPESGVQTLDEIPMSRTDLQQSGPSPDYYYDEMYKNKLQQQQRLQQQQQQVPQYPVIPPANYQQRNEPPVPVQPAHPKEVPHNEPAKPSQPAQTATPAVQTTTTASPHTKEAEGKNKEESASDSSHEAHGSKSSHRKVDKLTADVRVKDSLLNLEEELHVNSPRGAVLSLTMGLCITGIMLILVGCRMRMVTKRMRRGGKGYAHDADFLVNGMYL